MYDTPTEAFLVFAGLISFLGIIIGRTDSARDKAAWTFFVYMAADNSLDCAAIQDIDEMELVGSSQDVNFVVQIDRAGVCEEAVDNWAGTRRLLIAPDQTPQTINSEMLGELGQTNTGDPATLIDFVTWGAQNYPAEHYSLILWDHGGSWLGIGVDDSADGDALTLPDLKQALAEITQTTDIKQFDIIGFDACLMGSLEVYRTIAPFAIYSIASPELVPGEGWSYRKFFQDLIDDPSMDADTLGRAVVDSFYVFYTEITTQYHFFSLALVDLSKSEALNAALNDFSEIIMNDPATTLPAIVTARYNALVFASHFSTKDFWSAVDLAQFMQLLLPKIVLIRR